MSRKIYDYQSAPEVIEDGSGLRVPAFLMDSGRRHATIGDAIREDCRVFSGHRPMPIQDMQFAVSMSVSDTERLAGAMARREQAFDELCKRSSEAWRRSFADAAKPLNAMPPLPPEPAAQNGDDDEVETAPPDPNDPDALERAQGARERAYQEAVLRSANAWNAANSIQQQAARWRNGA